VNGDYDTADVEVDGGDSFVLGTRVHVCPHELPAQHRVRAEGVRNQPRPATTARAQSSLYERGHHATMPAAAEPLASHARPYDRQPAAQGASREPRGITSTRAERSATTRVAHAKDSSTRRKS
jgi:hypothetical protein